MGTTPTWGLPYPEASTLITDSAAIVQTLAEKIDAALSQVTASDQYTIPGTLVQTFTTSGTFTPPPGVTVVHVAVIAGGANGGTQSAYNAGGDGGGVRVYRDVPVAGPVAVVVGGAQTASVFGALSAPGASPAGAALNGAQRSRSWNHLASGGGSPLMNFYNSGAGRVGDPGQDGPTINGTHYAGGGGGAGGTARANGGAGGGGQSGYRDNSSHWRGLHATSGTGGGGGGGATEAEGYNGLGGSGCVIVYTEQPYRRSKIAVPEVDPRIVAALDDTDTMTGAYAVDPDLDLTAQDPRLVPYPADPQPTGRMLTVPVDPEDPDGPTTEVPEVAWPTAGWTYDNGGQWRPPATPKEVTP